MPAGPADILLVAATFVIAGTVKGVTGMGLPTVAVGLLGLLMLPAEAAALLIIPSLVTNVWQFIAGPNRLVLLRRMWPMLLAIFLATWASAGLITGGDARYALAGLGGTLVVYALVSLAQLRMSVPQRTEAWLSPIVDSVTGVVTGATGVFVMPAVPYLQALGLGKEDLVQGLGLCFTVSTVALAVGLARHGAFLPTTIGASVLCTAPALLGMCFGQWVRMRVNAETFRLLFFVGLLVLGGDLAVRSIG